MNILALDIATRTGWAAKTVNSPRLYGGYRDFPVNRGESPGIRFLRFRACLAELLKLMGKINLIVFEQEHHRGGASTAVALGLQAEMLAFAAEHNIETMPVHSSTLKKWATGKGNADKANMIEAARAYCPDVSDDNHADAILLLEYARKQFEQ